jgi:hypothetical protein
MNDADRRHPRIARWVGLATLAILVFGFGCWSTLVLAFAGPGSDLVRGALVVGFGLASAGALVALFIRRWRWPGLGLFAALCLAVAVLWSGIAPTNDRDWQPEVAVLPFATIVGDEVTVHNIRNFDYRSETDYTVNYYDKRFDLRQLQTVDIVTSYWMGPAIAHVFLSFGFAGDDYLAISIEVRKPKGREYSTLGGLFRQYELIYVAADERDVIRLRTNYRRNPPEEVYIYRTRASSELGRRLFGEYMERINALRTHPEFYNTLTTNCTTAIWMNDRVNPERVPLNWKVVASGYVPEYLYEEGRLEDMGLSFPDLQRRAHVNARAMAADSARDFSQRIRDAGLATRGSASLQGVMQSYTQIKFPPISNLAFGGRRSRWRITAGGLSRGGIPRPTPRGLCATSGRRSSKRGARCPACTTA